MLIIEILIQVGKDVLYMRKSALAEHYTNIDGRIIPYLKSAGFYGVALIGVINIDWNLVTALIESWRTETHTFHLSGGESTITL